MEEILEQIEGADAPSWVVQLFVVSVSERSARDLGVDIEPGLELSYLLASGGSSVPAVVSSAASTISVGGTLDAILRASVERDGVEVVADPLMLVADGAEATFVRGDSIPVPRRTVSDQGTVTTTQFDFVQTGLEVKSAVRELAAGRARLRVDVRLSSLRSFVEDAPVTSDESFSAEAIVESGGETL